MTHRLFSRNSASSRAIPVKKMLDMIKSDPVLPKWWGKNQSGMQAKEELDLETQKKAIEVWLKGRDRAVETVEELLALNVHKQIANRIVEPWMFITVIVSATEFDNWDALRAHPDAQPEIGWVAQDMLRERALSTPKKLLAGSWHLPLISDEEYEEIYNENPDDYEERLKKISTGRVARVSYLTHDGRRDYNEDISLHDKLSSSNHWSPFEHVAQALDEPLWIGNFVGFKQYRKEFANEHVGGSLEQKYKRG
jgi:thymidylate synthase ThyX